MTKNKLLLLLVLLTMLSTRAVAQNDASAMRELMKGRLDELTTLAPENVKGLNETLKNDVNVYKALYTGWYNASPLKSYDDYEEAYDHLGFIIDRVNKYLAAYKEFTDNMAKLQTLINNFKADTEKKQGYKTFAQDVYNAYKALSDYDMIALDDDDVEAQKEYDDDVHNYVPDDVTSENIADVEGRPSEYISTYGQFNAFFIQNTKELGSIYLKVAGTGTAESPENLTAQLRNPNLKNAGEQWWGTEWTSIGNNLAEHRGNNTFDTYQMVHLPQGYYTLVGYGMDRRGSWEDVLANDREWRWNQRTDLYAITDNDGNDTTHVEAFSAKDMALTADITEGAGNISTCKVNGVTYYTPNDMAQYRAWEDANIAMAGQGHRAVLQFEVYEDDFGKLGFAHRWPIDNTWFVADGIHLYYAKDNFPDISIDTPIAGDPTYAVTLAEGTEEADKWTVKVGEGEAQAFPVEGLKGGEDVTVKYNGSREVKSVTVVKVAKGGAVDNTYMKWDADQKKLVATPMPAEVTTVADANQDVFWQAGTYVVEGEVNITGTIELSGDVNLIIKDGAKLTANKIAGNSNNLSIYGQAQMTGELVVNCSDADAIKNITTLEVHSAKVTATSSYDNSGGIYDIGTFNVYGGLVDAKSTAADGCGISLKEGGSMNIYGGEVKAEGKGEDNFYGYGIVCGSTKNIAIVKVYGGKLWAGNANKEALNDGIDLQKGDGFTGKIETSSDNEFWEELPPGVIPNSDKYVRVGY